MNVIMLILSLVPMIIDLMKIVEADYAAVPKSGADKKADVLAAVAAIVADNTVWGKIVGFITNLIDVLAKIHLGATK